MIKNNRNNEQIYGRNDMIMLDPNNKIYGSLGLADKYVMKTEEGTRLKLSNPKLGSFADVLTEFNIYGRSEQESTTGANLIDVDSMLNECLVKNADGTYSILRTETNRFSESFPINLKAGTKVRFDADVIEYNGTYPIKLQCAFGKDTVGAGSTIILRYDATKVSIYQDGENDVGTYTKFKNAILSVGEAKVPYEPYTGGKPSPSPDYPQEIKSVVNPIVKVTNEDELKVQSVTLNNITLNAIQVGSGGNVIINGQQYIADYVDVDRGKLYKKVKRINVKDVEDKNVSYGSHSNGNGYLSLNVGNVNVDISPISNQYRGSKWTNKSGYVYIPESGFVVIVDDRFIDRQTAIKLVQDTYVFYALASQIEINLAPEVIEQYKKLSVKAQTTIIENNYNTWMKATYKSTESV